VQISKSGLIALELKVNLLLIDQPGNFELILLLHPTMGSNFLHHPFRSQASVGWTGFHH